MACLWGLTGLANVELDCEDENAPGLVELGGRPLRDFGGEKYVSWISSLYGAGGKTSPDDPCLPDRLYASSLHFSVMTLVGSMIWAYVIGECCGAVANMDPLLTAFQHNMDSLNYMMNDQAIPKQMQKSLRSYFRES